MDGKAKTDNFYKILCRTNYDDNPVKNQMLDKLKLLPQLYYIMTSQEVTWIGNRHQGKTMHKKSLLKPDMYVNLANQIE